MRRLLLVAASAALLLLGLQPAANGATAKSNTAEVFTVWDGGSYEYFKTCSGAPSFTCGTYGQTMYVQITGSYPPRQQAIVLNYQITDITATSGLDYTYPATGTVTIPGGQYVTGLYIPIVVDSLTEGSETFRVSLTHSSVGGNISDTGVGTISDNGLIPPDCNLSQADSKTVSMACSGRPANQTWYNDAFCGDEWPRVEYEAGNQVTGNGTSTSRCISYAWRDADFVVVS